MPLVSERDIWDVIAAILNTADGRVFCLTFHPGKSRLEVF